MLEERIRLILDEFGHVPEAQEVRDVYSSYYSVERPIPAEALKVIESLEDEVSRKSWEQKIQKIDSPITDDQKKATQQIYERKKVIVPYGTGTGKTHSAIAASYSIKVSGEDLKTVIISPKANNLKHQWSSRIEKYSRNPENEKIVIINNEREVNGNGIPVIWNEKDERSQEILKDSDFIIINYHMVPKWKHLLPKQAYGIIDEGHNILDETRFIAGHIKDLVKEYPYLAFLTATPMPNSIRDVEYPIRVISGDDNFRIPGMVKDRTQVVRNHLRQYFVLPVVSIEDTLQANDGKKVSKNEHYIEVELSPEHREFYNKIFESEIDNDNEDIIRLTALRQAALDPEILSMPKNGSNQEKPIAEFANSLLDKNPELRNSIENRIYGKLVEIVKENYLRGEKTVVYSDFVTGVIDNVRDLLEREGIPTLVYSNKDIDVKQKLFQIEPEIGAIIGSPKSIGEGASYTSANNAIFLMPPYEYYKIIQGTGRLLRPGQQNEEVNVFYLYGKNTINHGILRQTLSKGNGIVQVLNGVPISDDWLDDVINDKITSSKTVRGYLHPLNEKQLLRNLIGALINRDVKDLEKILASTIDLHELSGNVGELFTSYYNSNFDTSYQANVARAYSKILQDFDLERVLDAAGGAATASRILGKPTTVIDINQYQLEAGKAACSELGIDNEYIKTPLQNMEVAEGSYDAVIYSLGLSWATKTDRVKILRNLNKSLREDGTLVLTLPKASVDEKISEKLGEGMQKLGFSVLEEYTGNVASEQDSDFGVYILTARKTGYVDDKVNADYFDLKKIGKSRRGTKVYDENNDPEKYVESILKKEINDLYSRSKEGKKALDKFAFKDGRGLGRYSVEEDIVDSLREISHEEVETLANRLIKRYEPKSLYKTCEQLLEAVNRVEQPTYGKIEMLFDQLAPMAKNT